jgi:FAD/FMN-containing dehydrogenase/Fe-S oxidoreductase
MKTMRVPARVDLDFRGGMAASVDVDRRMLARELREAVEGEVRFDTATRALYATDASNFRQVPIGVVVPRSIEDIVAIHEVCRRHGAPILPRGAGTSLSGETVNAAVVVDCSKYLNAIGEVDTARRLVTVEPGAINEQVNAHTGDLLFGPDPSTHAYCTIGGNVGNNSCGAHSLLAAFEGDGGRTSDNVHELDVLTYDGVRLRVGRTSDAELEHIVAEGGRRGEIYAALCQLRDRYADLIRDRYPRIPRRVSGYNLDDLLPENGFHVARALCGTEGTCVTVLGATLALIPRPRARSIVVLGFHDIYEAGDHVPVVLEHRPSACEGIDHILVELQHEEHMHERDLELLPGGKGWLLVEFGGESKEEADAKANELVAQLRRGSGLVDSVLYDDPDVERRLWEVREAGLAATAIPPRRDRFYWAGWDDSAVAPEALGAYLRDLRSLLDRYGYETSLYGHFGQGCVHTQIDFDLRTADGIARYRAFVEDAADLCVSHGGSLSGEHGDGQQRAELLPKMFGDELVQAFREFKRIWDPDWKMNPGKVVDAYRLDEHLKLGRDYEPWRPHVAFDYVDDRHDFANAALRCMGIGKCRTPEGAGVMCPSYIVTREEMHTTRGRARLLYEMLEHDVVRDRWRSEEVKEALDLCLACKGCTSDCPVHVDMPTYKAEFLHGYYRGRLRPRHAYAFGLIDKTARVASHAPELANLLAGTRLAKLAAGIAPQRPVPRFAPLTLRDWFRGRGGPTVRGGPEVLLWADTFNTYFHTEVGMAAVEELERAGYRVVLPDRHVCCGRPLHDYGFLDLARRYLDDALDVLRPYARAGTPIVGIEPSCTAVFKYELPLLLPSDDARRVARHTRHFAEFLHERQVAVPPLERTALHWGHCHHNATGGTGGEHELLSAMGLDVRPVSGGCCGLAGSWGFEAAHYELSMACGEHALLPAIRNLPPDSLVVADGFSCKTQIEHGTGRRALHVAQVLKLAHGGDPFEQPQPPLRRRARRAGVLAGAALAGAAVVWSTR